MRIAMYTRISTDEDRQPFSLGAQAERLEAYAASQDGWRTVRRFSDQASGAALGRPGLRKALQDASAGVYELLLVYRVDRLSRNVRQLAQIAEDLDQVGVTLRSATEPFDTSSAAGKMMLQMLGVFAEFERTTIVERITAGMERGASQGRWVVGRVPFGYVRDPESKLLHPLSPQVEVVRRAFALYTEGQMGAAEIAKVLNGEGHAPSTGVPFSARSVLRLLSNPIYVGRIEFRGTTYPGLHEAMSTGMYSSGPRGSWPSAATRRGSSGLTRASSYSPGWSGAGGADGPLWARPPTDGPGGIATTLAPPATATARHPAMPSGYLVTNWRKPCSSRLPRCTRTLPWWPRRSRRQTPPRGKELRR